MSNPTEYSRLVMKRSQVAGVTPSIATSSVIDNTWLDTDILTGELFYNIEDKKLWTRSGEDIVLLSQGITGSATDIYSISGTVSGTELIIERNDGFTFSTDLSSLGGGANGATGATGATGADGTGTAYYGQVSKVTSGIIGITTAGVYQSTGLVGTLDSENYGITLGTDTFSVKNTTGLTQLFKIYGSTDIDAGNNKVLGIKLALNGTPIDETECNASTGNSTSFAKLVTNWMIELAPDDEVALYVTNFTNSGNVTFLRGRLVASTVGKQGEIGPTGSTGPAGPVGATGSTGPISRSFGITIDGGGSPIAAGTKSYIQIPYSGTITGWTLVADVVGDIVIDLWKDTYINFPPTVADTITGTEKPSITGDNKNEDNDLTTWNTTVNAGDIIAFNVDSATTITSINLSINVTSTGGGVIDDIYSTTMSLAGTELIIERNDGGTFSTDLSSLTGGGATPSLSDVLLAGNTTGNNWIEVDETSTGKGLFSGAFGSDFNLINFNPDKLLLYSWDGVSPKSQVTLSRDGAVDIQGNEIGISAGNSGLIVQSSDIISFDSISDFIIKSPTGTFSGAQYDMDYSANFTNRSLVDKEYVDNAIGGGATPSLSEVLLVGNATLGSNIVLGDDKIINATGSATMSIFFTEGTINLWNDSATDRDGRLLLNTGTSLSYLYNRTYTGTTYSEGKLAFNNSTTKLNVYDSATTAEASLSQDLSGGTPTQTILSVDPAGRVSEIYLEGNGYMNMYVDDLANSINIDMVPSSGLTVTTSNGTGIEYAADYSATFTNRSLVDKAYVDNLPVEIVLAASDEITALTTGTNKVTFRMPHAMNLTEVRCSLTDAQTSGATFTVDINESGTSILSTKLTIDNTEKTSTTATTPAVISDANLADDAEITIDIDTIGDGTAKGLKITLIGTR